MKTLIAIILITTALTFSAQAQFSNGLVSTYNNELIEAVQGYQLDFMIDHENRVESSVIQVSEYMDFMLLRSMVSLITTSNSNVDVFESWKRDDGAYTYVVVIERKYMVGVMYMPEQNLLITAYQFEQ